MTSLTLKDIEQARQRIGEHIFLTPCARTESLSRRLGCKLFLKLENLQMTGSFKERGAFNKILQLDAAQRQAGIITASAGNHAQAVAHAAQQCQIPATIVMPETTPLAKIQGTREFGATIVLHGSGYDEAYDHAIELQKQHAYTFVHAFDDNDIIAGQGTIGLEILQQVPQLDLLVVPVGGGGLIAGIAMVVKETQPDVRIIGVEARNMAAMQGSLTAGKVTPLPAANTLADGIAVARVGQRTLPLVQDYVDDIVSVDEEAIAHAIMILLEREKTLAEGAGAVGFAALQQQLIQQIVNKNVVVLLSGGNIDMSMLSRILERGLEQDGRLSRFKVVVSDQPGSIARLASAIAEQQANILRISQNRAAHEVELGETEIELLLETRGMEHVTEIDASLRHQGFNVK